MRISPPARSTAGRLPHVEVVVPCYNYGHFLPLCVEAAVRQPGVRTSVTILDDKSTDDSLAVAERLAATYPNVKVLPNDVNLGAVTTFNKGIAQADSDYVVLISADDMLAPGALQRATGLMDARPQVGFVYGHSQKFSDAPVVRRPLPVTWSTWDGGAWIETQLRRSWSSIASPEVVVRTSVQHDVGMYDPDLPNTHDAEMWLRIAAVADVGHVNGADQAYYRRHASSMHSQLGPFRDIQERWRAYRKFLDAWDRRDRAVLLLPVVRRNLADEALAHVLQGLEHGGATAEVVERALELARSIDPSVVDRGPWADVQARRDGRGPWDVPSAARSTVRDIKHAVRWHRFRKVRPLG